MTRRRVIANVERLAALMDRDGLDAVVARSGTNFTYLAGYENTGTLARHLDFSDSPRAVFVVWPRYGEPVLVLNNIAASRARRDSWVTQIYEYRDYEESPNVAVVDVLVDLGLESRRIGFEPTFISASDWSEIQRLLSEAELSSCTELMNEVRWIKTAGEIALIREAARLLDEAYLEVFPTVCEGDSEREVHSRLVAACLHRGASWAHGILNSSRNSVLYGGESDFAFLHGDMLRNDYVLWYRGYPGHQSRVVVLGEPVRSVKETYQIVRDIYRNTVAQLRPGVIAGDIYRFAAEGFRSEGLLGMPAIAGHGVGPWWHQQPPFIVNSSEAVIEPGMVIALEPHVGSFHIQDMFLITESGAENLSPLFSTDEMLTVP